MQKLILELSYHPSSRVYFDRLSTSAYAVFLNSSASSSSGRYDIICADPVAVIESSDSEPVAQIIEKIAVATEKYTSPGERADHICNGLPFIAGAIGVFSYSAGEQLIGISDRPDERWPQVFAGIYQWAIVQDHTAMRCWLVADEKLEAGKWQELVASFAAEHPGYQSDEQSDEPTKELRSMNSNADSYNKHDRTQDNNDDLNDYPNFSNYPNFNDYPNNSAAQTFSLTSNWNSSLDQAQYARVFAQLQEYIHSGDCYQVNLTREFRATYTGDPWQAFQQLEQHAPAPFSAFIRRPNAVLASCSPERFIALHDGRAVTQPIKGSRPRGADKRQDGNLIAELSASAKDRAENLMIVDLMRNDFGKVCSTGSISVPELFRVKSYSNVHHLVSTVTGQMPAQSPRHALQLLSACLPGGSVTGAPKKRAMQIIREVEPHSRSVYCGTLFYINRDGKMDSNILIRSLLFSNADGANKPTVYCWGGGGIVADSDCEDEFNESNYKIAHLLNSLKNQRS